MDKGIYKILNKLPNEKKNHAIFARPNRKFGHNFITLKIVKPNK